MIGSLVVLPLVVLYVACCGLLVRRLPVRDRPVYSSIKVGLFLSLSRLGMLWFLLVLYWLEQLQYWHLMLMVFLLPEALLLPRNVQWSLDSALLASGLLLTGSFVAAFLLVQAYRRWVN